MTSNYRAQDVLICNVCKRAQVQKYCKNCGKNLCNDCISCHVDGDTTISHEIAAFKSKNKEPSRPYCDTHNKHKCEMFCRDCHIALCIKCISLHERHSLEDIMTFLKSQKEFIQQYTEQMEACLIPRLKKTINTSKLKIQDLETECDNSVAAITKQELLLKGEIDKIVTNLKSKVKRVFNRNCKTLNEYIMKLENKLSIIERTISDGKVLFNSNKMTHIIKFEPLPTFLTILDAIPTLMSSSFAPLPIENKTLIQMFGTFQDSSSLVPTGESLSLDIPIILKQIDTGYQFLHHVACFGQDKVWVSGNSSQIKCFNLDGTLVNIVETKNRYEPDGIAVTRKGYLVYIDTEDNSVNIRYNNKISKMITDTDWRHSKVCSTDTDDLLVSMQKDDTCSRVVRYSELRQVQVIQFDVKENPLFSSGILRVSENMNGDVCISDRSAKNVVVVNRFGCFRFNYTGNLTCEKNESFGPGGIANDSRGQILVTDYNNNCIHIIDKDGRFICYFNDLNLNKPTDLCVDMLYKVYVAQRKPSKVVLIKYQK